MSLMNDYCESERARGNMCIICNDATTLLQFAVRKTLPDLTSNSSEKQKDALEYLQLGEPFSWERRMDGECWRCFNSAIPAIMGILQTTTAPETKAAACKTLFIMSKGVACRKALIKAGAIKLLVEVLEGPVRAAASAARLSTRAQQHRPWCSWPLAKTEPSRSSRCLTSWLQGLSQH